MGPGRKNSLERQLEEALSDGEEDSDVDESAAAESFPEISQEDEATSSKQCTSRSPEKQRRACLV